jgi:hypothetical protein
MLRNFPLFHFKHGDHICVFYQSEDALMEVLTPFIAEGLRNGECCFCHGPSVAGIGDTCGNRNRDTTGKSEFYTSLECSVTAAKAYHTLPPSQKP